MTTRARVAVLLVTLLVGPAFLAGCGEDDPTEPASSATLDSQESSGGSVKTPAADTDTDADADADAATVPPFTADTKPDVADASADARVTVRDIRIGGHDGFDRVVFEVGGTGTPGWKVEYVDAASSQGRGDAIAVAGDAILEVVLTGAGYPYDTGVEEYAAAKPLSVAGTDVVTELVFDSTFEGTSVAFVGTSKKAPFRVYAMQNPTRVVLEVATA